MKHSKKSYIIGFSILFLILIVNYFLTTNLQIIALNPSVFRER